jgi:hypothetical protein
VASIVIGHRDVFERGNVLIDTPSAAVDEKRDNRRVRLDCQDPTHSPLRQPPMSYVSDVHERTRLEPSNLTVSREEKAATHTTRTRYPGGVQEAAVCGDLGRVLRVDALHRVCRAVLRDGDEIDIPGQQPATVPGTRDRILELEIGPWHTGEPFAIQSGHGAADVRDCVLEVTV